MTKHDNKQHLKREEMEEQEKRSDSGEERIEFSIKQSFPFDEQKQRAILRRSKWKARFQTAVSAIAIMIAVLIVTSILTTIYYAWGEPDRAEQLANVINYTVAVTDPYGRPSGTSTGVKTLFRMEATKDLVKRVGRASNKVGELKVNYLFSMMGYPERNYITDNNRLMTFIYPYRQNASFEHVTDNTWDRLNRLPEGTVVSAYVSFAELLETRDVFQLFADKDVDLLWFAVDTGMELNERRRSGGVVTDPIGFPSSPIWHEDDFKVTSREESGSWFGKTVSETRSSPEYKIGDYEVLHAQFFKTLRFLQNYENHADKLYYGQLKLGERIAYLEEHGVKHYGAVITGPTKEVLSLRGEPSIALIEVDEVDFWNW